ncbi:MAG TPA: Rieske (2Fe-2S) protein, partial [Methylomirabilota bacterium]|nr:Rieske (2Fe-2S) protein [Methylomirabilota bacterium]
MTGGAWTCVGTSAAVAPGGRIRVFVDGEEYVLWRGASGVARMFHNRCPHRGMRLSFGFVRGETLTCPYHGWRYSADGRCVGIPAHPDLEPPATIRAPILRVIEAAGLLFAAPAESADTAPPVPDGPYRPCRSIAVDAGPGALQAALRSELPAGWSIASASP